MQASDGLEFNVTKALGLVELSVLDDTNIGDTTFSKKFSNIGSGGLEGQVSNVCGEWRLGRKIERLTNGVSATSLVSTAFKSSARITV